jgi:hypothetical protein
VGLCFIVLRNVKFWILDDSVSELERLDKILRISRSWSPEPTSNETATEPLTFEELISAPESRTDVRFFHSEV